MITKYKIFENSELYKEGDYVFVDLSSVNNTFEIPDTISIDNEFDNELIVPAKITDILKYVTDYPYCVSIYNGQIDPALSQEEIKRKLTPDEIELYKAKIEGTKYNL